MDFFEARNLLYSNAGGATDEDFEAAVAAMREARANMPDFIIREREAEAATRAAAEDGLTV